METSVVELLTRAADSTARRHVGVVLGLVDARSGETVVAGRGSTERPDGPPVGASTLFEIGSVTKTFTALLLADAVVRDEVHLDTPLRAIVPAGVGVPSRDGVDITLEDLATHRSGLPHSPLGWAPPPARRNAGGRRRPDPGCAASRRGGAPRGPSRGAAAPARRSPWSSDEAADA